jgi:hypothetical protein
MENVNSRVNAAQAQTQRGIVVVNDDSDDIAKVCSYDIVRILRTREPPAERSITAYTVPSCSIH